MKTLLIRFAGATTLAAAFVALASTGAAASNGQWSGDQSRGNMNDGYKMSGQMNGNYGMYNRNANMSYSMDKGNENNDYGQTNGRNESYGSKSYSMPEQESYQSKPVYTEQKPVYTEQKQMNYEPKQESNNNNYGNKDYGNRDYGNGNSMSYYQPSREVIYQKPVYVNSYQQPEHYTTYQKPVYESSYRQPVEYSNYEPVRYSSYQQPVYHQNCEPQVYGTSYQRPVYVNYQQPVVYSDYQRPMYSNASYSSHKKCNFRGSNHKHNGMMMSYKSSYHKQNYARNDNCQKWNRCDNQYAMSDYRRT